MMSTRSARLVIFGTTRGIPPVNRFIGFNNKGARVFLLGDILLDTLFDGLVAFFRTTYKISQEPFIDWLPVLANLTLFLLYPEFDADSSLICNYLFIIHVYAYKAFIKCFCAYTLIVYKWISYITHRHIPIPYPRI